ncbi:MAG TPA: response regulator [Chloroflexi bacterium]|nr:response regulator [Chloroflexota bacterium]
MDVRILLVDDSPAVIEALTNILVKQGYQVEAVTNGRSGWHRLVAGAEDRAPMPDLVLLDLNMPEMDGLTLLARLRADARFALLPVVILTVESDSKTQIEALEAGANDYLAKPVQALELLARVQTLLSWKLAERNQKRQMERLIEAGRAFLSTLDLDAILDRAMRITMDEIEAENATIWMREDSGDGLTCRAASGRHATYLLGLHLAHGEGIPGWVLTHQEAVLIADARNDPRRCRRMEAVVDFQMCDLAAVPLIVRGSCIGVLEMINKRDGAFSATDLSWLEVLASTAAAAIANARLFQALRQRTTQLKARNEELDAFAHTVAHDLKTPLGTIVGFAETLEVAYEEISTEDACRYLHMIGRSGRRMNRIIDGLLLLAGVRKAEVEMEPLNMGEMVAEVLERLSGMVQNLKAEIHAPETWPVVLGYAPWIEEVWVNYISNALKYGGRPPRVMLGARQLEDQMTYFWVRDNGKGLSREAQARLFVPFTRLEQGQMEGQGLGLSIVRRIVEKLGGQVSVDSTPGQGSVFGFTLPSVDSQLSDEQGARDVS